MRRAVPSLFLSATVGILALAPGAASYTCLYEEGLVLAKDVALQCFQTDLIYGGGYFDFGLFTSSRSKQRDTLCASSCLTSLGNFRKFMDDCSSKECKANPFPITASSQVCSYSELSTLVEQAKKKGDEHWRSVIEAELRTKQVSGEDYKWDDSCTNPPQNLDSSRQSIYECWYGSSPNYCNGCGGSSYAPIGPVCGSFCFTNRYENNVYTSGYHSLFGSLGINSYSGNCGQCTDDFAGSSGNVKHATRVAFMCKPDVSVEIGKLASIVDKCMAELCGADEYKKVFAGPTVGVLQESSSGVGNLKGAWAVLAAWCASALAALLM